MKFLALIILFQPILLFGQQGQTSSSEDKLSRYIVTYSNVDGSVASFKEISNFIKKLERKEMQKKSTGFIRHLFLKTHQEFLKHYAEYASFSETLDKGRYNCLTGTALYALLLDHFDIEYKVIETNYHIFLLASTGEGQILCEATDPLNGFIEKPKDIDSRINLYKQNRVQETSIDKKYYRYNFNLYSQVSLDQIEGLLHYNFSIMAFNEQNLHASIQRLDRALDLYNSPRILEFSTILLLSVMESKLDNVDKENCIKNIQAIRKKQMQVMASRISD